MSQRRVTIICVDDERIVLSSLRDQLGRHLPDHVSVELAESGEEGLEVFDELVEDGETVPLVISDQLMPGMRGEAFLAAVHERDPRVLNVLLTGQATADAVGKAVNQAGLYRYIAKPWGEADLVLTVREALRAWQQARDLEHEQAEAQRSHLASLRFVPREFLALLGRERLVDVDFGDHTERPMHILFTDMRGYTALVEGKTTAEAFAFINRYMQCLDAAIREHGGFVSNIEGDAVLSLFSGSADEAVAAGLACHAALDAFNTERAASGEAPVRMGVGISSGPLLLGTVGGVDRLQCDVVGDPVNLASRVESLCKHYGARMLVSHHTAEQLAKPPRMRVVDTVQAKGRREPVTLYEVLDAQPDAVRDARLATRERFDAARQAWTRGELGVARAAFAEVADADPTDKAAVVYVARCDSYATDGIPGDWSGVTRLAYK